MNIEDLEKEKNEGIATLPLKERRKFLQMGLAVTGVFLGGSVLSLTSAVHAADQNAPEVDIPTDGQYPYPKHYGMVMRQNRCVGCEKCVEACKQTNHVPDDHGAYRTAIQSRVTIVKMAPKNANSGQCSVISATVRRACGSVQPRPPIKTQKPALSSWIMTNVSAAKPAWLPVPTMPVILMKKSTPLINATSVLIPVWRRARRKPPVPLSVPLGFASLAT
jgi:ferredoxin